MTRDDSVLLPVRLVALLLVGVLAAAVAVLYGLPDETDQYWVWTIDAPMTAMLMGAGYAAGAYFFARAAVTRSWRMITLGFLPASAFTAMLLIATLLHWELFHSERVVFYAWLVLSVVTPVLIPVLWYFNRATDRGRQPGEVLIPLWSRGILIVVGVPVAALALLLFVSPDALSDGWPWELTPLTARTVAAFIGLSGAILLLMAWDARWRAAKAPAESLLIGLVLLAIAIVRAWETLDPSETVRWVFAAAIGGALLLLLGLQRGMQAAEDESPELAIPPIAGDEERSR